MSHSPSWPGRFGKAAVLACSLWTTGLAFPSCAFFLQMALRTLFADANAGSPTMDHGLFNGSCLRYLSIAARIVPTKRRSLEIFSVFLLHCCIKKLSVSHIDLLLLSLLSEFQTLFGLKTIL